MIGDNQLLSKANLVSVIHSIPIERRVLFVMLFLTSLLYSLTLILDIGIAVIYPVLVSLILHFLIFSRDISTPIVFLLSSSVLLVPIFQINASAGVTCFFIISIYFFNRKLNEKDWFHIFPLFIFYSGVLFYTFLFSPLLLGDTHLYFEQLQHYSSIPAYLSILFENILSNPIWLSSFYDKLPIVYLPFYFSLDLTSPLFIIIINSTLWVLSALMLVNLSIEYTHQRIKSFSPLLFFSLLLASPTFILHSSQFNKEIPSIFFVVLSVHLFLKNRYLLFLVISIAAFYSRPYVISAIVVYILLFKGRIYLMVLTTVGSATVAFAYSGTWIIIPNGILILGYMFWSPLPFDISNWLLPRTAFRQLESSITGLAAIVSSYLIFIDKNIKLEYLLITFGICTWAFTLAWQGFYRVQLYSWDGPAYGLFVIGSHVARKVTPIQPLLLMWVVLTIGVFRDKILNLKFQNTY